MLAVVLVWLPFGVRGVRSFLRETVRFQRGYGRWLLGWPRATFTGRFRRHSGHFDPGQRLANIVIVIVIVVLLGVVVLGVVVAAGILPGYRGCGGRLPVRVARGSWPTWLDQTLQDRHDHEVRVSKSRRS
jgi:formate dehydrogenase subunit gamma